MLDLSARAVRLGLITATALTVLGLGAPAALAVGPPAAAGLKTVSYRGYEFAVPAGWPVISISRTATTCVRFDRHAVYLGDPGQNQDCPSGLLGTTEAVLVQPAPGPVAAAAAAEDQASRRITVVSPGIEVTATYASDPALVRQILASAALPLPGTGPGATPAGAGAGGTGGPAAPVRANAAERAAAPVAAATMVPARATSYTGQGFDACAAPSSAVMSAWKSASPFGAVGIYIGGAERACAQPNLTASWVAQQAAAGWHFLPTYVGVQAEFSQITSPASQAAAAAQDAVTQAAALGFGPGTPIYYDMEAYPASQKSSALAFLSAWTTGLHAAGYKSGVYSSSSSGIADLVANFTTYAMPDVIWDALWNGAADTADPVIPAADWASQQRAHQFRGGADATYGGDTVNIDQDYLDVNVLPPGPVSPGQPALSTHSGAVADYVIRGRNLFTYTQSPGASVTGPKQLTTTGNLTGTPVAVQAANGTISVYARTTGGAVKAVWQSAAGAAATKSANLGGHIAASPVAIALHNGTVAVYAVGTDRNLYTYYQAGPGTSVKGPRKLTSAGNLTGTPSAVQVANGTISVYARTTGGAVQAVWQSAAGGAITKRRSLGGNIIGSPAAAVTAGNTIAVYSVGTNRQLYSNTQPVPGAAFTGPVKLTSNGGLTGTLIAIPNANGTVSVFARTVTGSLRAKWQSVAGGPFASSASLGGHIAGDLAGLAGGDGAVSLYGTGTDGRQYADRQAAAFGVFGGWVVI